ncbi:MAG TPA: TerB family tellurite resistance protein [Flavobacterium lutivivi]|nr:TerB family tellurite resistance protein [Flavobacterium lutivivi]
MELRSIYFKSSNLFASSTFLRKKKVYIENENQCDNIFHVVNFLILTKNFILAKNTNSMSNYEEKIALLSDMIAFAIVDGELHEREYMFLSLIAIELGIDKNKLNKLFHEENRSEVIKSEFERIQQFYRLALLMHCDGVLHEREQIKIHEIGINMGLNPHAIKRVLKAMETSPTKMVSPEYLLEVFQEQHN